MPRERDLSREACPDRIIGDSGGAFGMGCLGGFIWHFIKGARNSPRKEKFSGALYSATTRAPILGGNFAVWGGTFGTFECTFQYLRQKDDHWNSIASGFFTGGTLALRGGLRPATRSAVIGGVLLAIIEFVSSVMTRNIAPTPRQQYESQLMYENSMKDKNNKQPESTFNQTSTSPGFV